MTLNVSPHYFWSLNISSFERNGWSETKDDKYTKEPLETLLRILNSDPRVLWEEQGEVLEFMSGRNYSRSWAKLVMGETRGFHLKETDALTY